MRGVGYLFPTMKKIILSTIVAAFACVSSVQAGENCKTKTCPDAAKAKGTVCSEQAKAKGTDCSEAKTCCASKAKAELTKAKADASVKGATKLLAKR